MISVSNISYYIGGRALYENASMFIKPKDKIGLIGLNGKGKSTLLKLINGELKPNSGSISKSNDCSIGFLNQDLLSYQSDDAIVTVAGGSATALISIPNRYMHSPNELVSLSDLENAVRLIAAFVQTIGESTDFRP